MTADKPTKSKVKPTKSKVKPINNNEKPKKTKVNPKKSKVKSTKSNKKSTKSKVNSTKGKVKPKNSQVKSKNNKKESTKSKVNPTINNLKSTNNNKQPEVFYYKTKGGYYYKQTQNGGSLRVSEAEYIGGGIIDLEVHKKEAEKLYEEVYIISEAVKEDKNILEEEEFKEKIKLKIIEVENNIKSLKEDLELEKQSLEKSPVNDEYNNKQKSEGMIKEIEGMIKEIERMIKAVEVEYKIENPQPPPPPPAAAPPPLPNVPVPKYMEGGGKWRAKLVTLLAEKIAPNRSHAVHPSRKREENAGRVAARLKARGKVRAGAPMVKEMARRARERVGNTLSPPWISK
jgi:hypothetical protein